MKPGMIRRSVWLRLMKIVLVSGRGIWMRRRVFWLSASLLLGLRRWSLLPRRRISIQRPTTSAGSIAVIIR